jgi:hypothetical protein
VNNIVDSSIWVDSFLGWLPDRIVTAGREAHQRSSRDDLRTGAMTAPRNGVLQNKLLRLFRDRKPCRSEDCFGKTKSTSETPAHFPVAPFCFKDNNLEDSSYLHYRDVIAQEILEFRSNTSAIFC